MVRLRLHSVGAHGEIDNATTRTILEHDVLHVGSHDFLQCGSVRAFDQDGYLGEGLRCASDLLTVCDGPGDVGACTHHNRVSRSNAATEQRAQANAEAAATIQPGHHPEHVCPPTRDAR